MKQFKFILVIQIIRARFDTSKNTVDVEEAAFSGRLLHLTSSGIFVNFPGKD